MTLFREFFSSETLYAVRLTLTYSGLALLISWALALLALKSKSRLLRSIFEFFWVLPGFAYALLTLFALRFLQVTPRYSMFSVLIAWIIAGVPYLTLTFRQALLDLDYREKEALQTLGANPIQAWFYFDFKRTLPSQAAALLQQFWLYLTSFSLVMILSGGPPYETLEVAIFTSMRLDQVDLTRAWALGLWQLIILASLRWCLKTSPVQVSGWRGKDSSPSNLRNKIFLLAGLLGLIFVWAKFTGLNQDGFLESLGMSLLLGILVSVFTLLLNFAFYYSGLRWLAEVGAWVSPMLLSLVAWRWFAFSFPPLLSCLLLQIILFSPWVARSFYPLLDRSRRSELEAARTLGASPIRAWYEIEWSRVRKPFGWMLGFIFSLSITEVTTVLLFSRNEFEPLSVWVQNAFMRFRIEEAAFGTAVLVLISYFSVKREGNQT